MVASRRRPRIVIADDHRLVADACKKLLESQFDVVGVVYDGRALIRAAEELYPDVVILDISMPELNGLDAGEQIKRRNSATKLVYLTGAVEPRMAAEAFRRGASGYVLKQSNAEELSNAIRFVLRGDSYLSPLITKDTVEFLLKAGAARQEKKRISSRQKEVLQLLAEGKSMKETAGVLQLKPGSVAFHKYRIMKILGLKTTAALIEYAISNHMISATQ
jgi:DNA-binding NarL/FixJ family response regulator